MAVISQLGRVALPEVIRTFVMGSALLLATGMSTSMIPPPVEFTCASDFHGTCTSSLAFSVILSNLSLTVCSAS